jgi:hypothetical protein
MTVLFCFSLIFSAAGMRNYQKVYSADPKTNLVMKRLQIQLEVRHIR